MVTKVFKIYQKLTDSNWDTLYNLKQADESLHDFENRNKKTFFDLSF